jgi:hypothetical protein
LKYNDKVGCLKDFELAARAATVFGCVVFQGFRLAAAAAGVDIWKNSGPLWEWV